MAQTIGWKQFWWIQFVAFWAMVAGWFLLIIPCMFKLWVPIEQIYQPQWSIDTGLSKKIINIWRWSWLNKTWGNDEDGVVSGLRDDVEYNPNASRWKAYLWSAWRNSANNLRFKYRLIGGPFYRVELYLQCGWNSSGFPVISAGKK